MKIIKILVGKYGKAEKSVAHLVVTHGFFVEKFNSELNGKVTLTDYCSISGASIEGEDISLIFDSDSKHVLTH